MQRAWRYCLLAAAFAATAVGQSRFDVYYVAIGSEHYIEVPDPAVHTFDQIDGVRKSARAVADFFDAGGSRYGLVVISDEGRFVGSDDVYGALRKLPAKIRADRAPNPIIVFYFAGHGVSEGIAWNHFSIPGNLAYRGNFSDLPVESLANSTVHAADVVDELEKTGFPFLVILDNCYEGKLRDFNSPVLTKPAQQGLEQTSSILKFMNEFHDTYPVLFSTAPGTTVTTSPDPRNPGTQVTGVAPLARRILIIKDRVNGQLRLGDLVSMMISSQLDGVTRPAVTNSLPVKKADVVLWSAQSPKGTHTETFGTAVKPLILRRAVGISSGVGGRGASKVAAPPVSRKALGTIALTGQQGEYISDGKSHAFSGGRVGIDVTQNDAGTLALEISEDTGSWEFSFSTGSGRPFEKVRYAAAQRFGETGHPGLEISAPGRGCNETHGEYSVDEVAFNKDGKVARFAAHFTQLCDDQKQVLTGTINVTLP